MAFVASSHTAKSSASAATPSSKSLLRRKRPSDSFTRNGAQDFCCMKASSVLPSSSMIFAKPRASAASVPGCSDTNKSAFCPMVFLLGSTTMSLQSLFSIASAM